MPFSALKIREYPLVGELPDGVPTSGISKENFSNTNPFLSK
jgi:hypothetical protein